MTKHDKPEQLMELVRRGAELARERRQRELTEEELAGIAGGAPASGVDKTRRVCPGGTMGRFLEIDPALLGKDF